jgi:hypothetical protein
MNKIILSLVASLSALAYGQSFSPSPGNPGSTAIKKDSSCFVGWATGGTITRGYINIADTNSTAGGSNRASFGSLNLAFGPATSSTVDVVSLGDSGVAVLTFDQFIINGPGYDFAVFENGFMDNYMELAHIEVSSDGVNYFRFPSTTEIQTTTQLGNASTSDCRMINNLAGKYRAGWGTPFDLSELPDNANLDKQAIQYVKVIDCIGAITDSYFSMDNLGTIINDPYPTPFESGGFDLEAVGIINGLLSINSPKQARISIFPNPASNWLTISVSGTFTGQFMNVNGQIIKSFDGNEETTIDVSTFENGLYMLTIEKNQKNEHIQLQIIH